MADSQDNALLEQTATTDMDELCGHASGERLHWYFSPSSKKQFGVGEHRRVAGAMRRSSWC